MSVINGFSTVEQKSHYDRAVKKYPNNEYAVKNSLKKHHFYSEDEAWLIIDKFKGRDSGVTLGDILSEVLANRAKSADFMVRFGSATIYADTENEVALLKAWTRELIGDDAQVEVFKRV